MSMQKLLAVGVLSLVGLSAFAANADAFGKRKRQSNNCNTCSQPAPTNCCGSGYAANVPVNGVPYAMPMAGGSAVAPAGGTTTAGGTVTPAGGIVQGSNTVIPASGMYYDPATRTYYSYPNNGNLIQGANGTYYYSDPAYNTTQRRAFSAANHR